MTTVGWRLCVAAWTAGAVLAQTRSAEVEAARDEKAARLGEEHVSKPEFLLLQVKQRKLMERLSAGYNGLRAKYGAMATSSGTAMGPEFFREDLRGGQLRVNASALVSTRLWQKYEAGVSAPRLAGDRLLLRLEATHRDYRSLEFFGEGPDARRGDRTVYRLRDTAVQAVGALKPARHVRVGGNVGGLWTSLDRGSRDEFGKTEDLFTPAQAPGLLEQPHYLRSGVFGQMDYRDDPLGPKTGGNYVVEHTWHSDQSLGAYSFRRWDLDAQQYIGFFNKTRRLALRARMTMADTAPGQRVPFYLQSYLGGSDDLRGFRPYRFTDRNAVVYNAEYRWEIFSGLDGALFFDAGKVMPHRTQLRFSELQTSAGFGFRFNARNHTFMRLDVGFSHEGVGVWMKFNDPFLPRLFGAGSTQPLY
jgi:outer membrane protein assembly factor BamA